MILEMRTAKLGFRGYKQRMAENGRRHTLRLVPEPKGFAFLKDTVRNARFENLPWGLGFWKDTI